MLEDLTSVNRYHPSLYTAWKTLGNNVEYLRLGNIIFVRGNSLGTVTITNVSTEYTRLGTLPSGYRPSSGFVTIGTGRNTNGGYIQIMIDYTGNIDAVALGTGGTSSYWGFMTSFPLPIV